MPSTTRAFATPAVQGILTWVAAVCLLFCGPAATVYAQAQKPPDAGYVYPPVVRVGEATDVRLGGYDWTDDLEWFVHRDDVRLEILGPPGDYLLTPPPYWTGPRASIPPQPIPREVSARIHVDAGAQPGLVRWQVANANGASSTAMLYVSDGQEILESRLRDLPQQLPALPVAVSGRLSRLTEVDRYEVRPVHDGLITAELLARRLGSKFQGMLTVHDSTGRMIADFADTQGLDGSLTFFAKQNETYTVSLHDVDFRGDRGFVYRLALSEGPGVLTALPTYGQRGTEQEVEFVGYGLSTGAALVESFRQTVSIPADAPGSRYPLRLQTPAGPVNVALPLSNLPEVTAASLRPDASGTAILTPPTAVTARFASGLSEARYTWTSPAGELWSLSVQSREIGGNLDVHLAVIDPTGKTILQNDDQPGTLDAKLELIAAQPGPYTAVVRNLSPPTEQLDEAYRLELRRQSPDFTLTLPQTVNLPLGGKATIKVTARRSGGWTGPIAVRIDGLPRGVSATGDWTIPDNKNDLTGTLEAAADADVIAAVLRIQGTGLIDGVERVHDALAPAGGNLCPATAAEQMIPQILLAVTMPPPFEVKVVDRERQREVHRGTTYLAPLEIVRQDGFTGPLQIAMTAQQSRDRQGIRGPLLAVPEDATQVQYPCTMPEWLGTDLTRRILVHGVGAVADPRGRQRWLTRAADARITMIMEGALLKLDCNSGELVARPGETVKVPVTVARSVKLPLETKVELVVPDEIRDVLEAAPVMLPPGQDQAVLILQTRPGARLLGPWKLPLQATALQDGRWPVTSHAELLIDFLAD